MTIEEIIKKVRRIEIKTRHMSSDLFSGSYQSAFKGRGMSFSEVRDYQYGDDVRNIDWNVTARMADPYIKVFEEERELTVVLLVDVSASSKFGTHDQLRSDLITEISAVLAFSAESNNDKIGALCFADDSIDYFSPKKGRGHVLRIITEISQAYKENGGTNLSDALKYINGVLKKRSIVFILSDFLDEGYSDALSIASRRHDVIGIRIKDSAEEEIPKIGLMKFFNAETGRTSVVDTSSKSWRKLQEGKRENRNNYFEDSFNKCSASKMDVLVGESYIMDLVRLFKKRSK